MKAREKIIAALERDQLERERRIAKLRKCDVAIFEQALATFESPISAGEWLVECVNTLGTVKGREKARQALGRIEHGVFS